MKKKILATLLSAMLVTALLVGCGGNGGDAPEPAPADTEETETAEEVEMDEPDGEEVIEEPGEMVRLYILATIGSGSRRMEELIPMFAEEGIEIILEAYDFVTYAGRQRLAIAAGGGEFDLIFMPADAVQIAARAGAIVDITDIMSEVHTDLSDVYESVLSYAMDDEGRWWIAPHSAETMVLYYRTDLIDEADLPTTLDELHALALLHTNEETYGLGIPAGPGEGASSYFSYFLWSYGGDFFDENWEPTLNTPEALAAVERYASLVQEVGPPGSTTWQNEEAVSAFQSGSLAMMIMWPGFFGASNDPEVSEVAGYIAVTPIPAGPNGARPRFGSWGLTVSASTQNLEAAKRVVAFWGSHENLETFSSFLSTASRSVNERVIEEGDMPTMAAIAASLPYARERPHIPEQVEVNTAIGNAINSIIAGMDAGPVLDALNTEVRAIMEAAGYYD